MLLLLLATSASIPVTSFVLRPSPSFYFVRLSAPSDNGRIFDDYRRVKDDDDVRTRRRKNKQHDGCILSKSTLHAKKRKRDQEAQDMDLFNQWYDSVDKDATPDDVFWDEIERQRRWADNKNSNDPKASTQSSWSSSSRTPTGGDGMTTMDSSNKQGSIIASASSFPLPTARDPSISSGGTGGGPTLNPDTVLESLAYASVGSGPSGWMEEDDDDDGDDEDEFEQQRRELDEQLDQLLSEDGSTFIIDEEAWDIWAQAGKEEEDEEEFDADLELEKESAEKARKEYEESLNRITISCKQLEKARSNSNARAFFGRPADESNGFDQMWVSAIDHACTRNLEGVFRDYGIQFAYNFGEWHDQSTDDAYRNIDDIAACKAKQVFEVTGLPCIASATSFEVESIKASTPTTPGGGSGNVPGSTGRFGGLNPRIASAYKFNKVGDHVDQLVEALIPASDPCRKTMFKSVLCFYDGTRRFFDYGECDVDLMLCNSARAFIPMSSAIQEMCETLQLVYNLEYQTWLQARMKESLKDIGEASLKLRDRVLKEAKVLPNEIIDVSAFMDSKVDVNLMDECGAELSQRFIDMKPTKILTVATTGLVIALPMAKFLQVPVVYARKERSVVMASTYHSPYSSKTVGKNRELIVSKDHIDADDRILIVDDFLSSGSSQEALLRIVADAGATAVGVGVLIEKAYDSGRQYLSGFNVKVESMIRVASVRNDIIQLMEEDGFNDIQN